MKIVIVGSGWLGKPLAEKLKLGGNSISVVYRSNKPELTAGINAFQLTEDEAITVVLNAADYVVFCFPPPKEGKSHAETCSELAKHCQTSCRFIFTSTTGVYPNENRTFDETVILDSANKHVATEQTLQKELGKRLTIVRLAGLVGEGRFPVRMMSKSGKTYNYNEYCNLIHLHDAVGIIEFLIEKKFEVPVVNACAPNHPLKGEYYTNMAEKLGVETPLFEKGLTGKCIQSDLSISLGYKYLLPNPYDFY